MHVPSWANLVYLIAAILFIFGIKGLTHPRTAVRGNLMSACGMLLAVIVTLSSGAFGTVSLVWWMIAAGLAAGAAAGAFLALTVQMTGMPQLVAVFNGFGGGASMLVAWAQLFGSDTNSALTMLIASAAAGIIGTVTLLGSFVAFAKLQDIKAISGNVTMPLHQPLNALLLIGALALGISVVLLPAQAEQFYLFMVIVAAVLGVMLVLPIGGADMPVVVALLNSYSGLAAAAAGFVLSNNMLVIAGSLVGASGLILTTIMCKAMNRSLTNVLFGKIEAAAAGPAEEIYEGRIKATSAEEVAMLLDTARRVAIVPGYGMAVAQAQYAVRDLYNELENRGIQTQFVIHPVAGRMPGHMNVLLAEVDIPYDKLCEMEQVNPEMSQIDVAIVLGANDVVNPDARKSDSAIAGMPIVNVDEAQTAVVIKRSLSPGFAGIPNPLFAADRTLMYFGDGKKNVTELVAALQEA